MQCTRRKPIPEILVKRISQEFLPNELSTVLSNSTGTYQAGASLAPVEKLEAFLTIVEEQRAQHLERHPDIDTMQVFSDADEVDPQHLDKER